MSQYAMGQEGKAGRMNGRMICKPRNHPFSGAFAMSITPDKQYNNMTLESEYKGSDYTWSSTLMPGLAALAYSQRVTNKWSTGIQGVNQFGSRSWLNYTLNYSTMKRKTDGEQLIVQV